MKGHCALAITLILGINSGISFAEMNQAIETCAETTPPEQRLACYDALFTKATNATQTTKTQPHNDELTPHTGRQNQETTNKPWNKATDDKPQPAPHIQPSQQFLQSELVVTPWISEYSLKISDFIKLLSSAVQDNGNKIALLGWTKHNNRYILDITMKSRVTLIFRQKPASAIPGSFSLLESVQSEHGPTDASLFVMTIATMVPDE